MKFSLVVMIIFGNTLNAIAADAKKGQELYAQCIACHGENGEGNEAVKAPKIGTQADWYVIKQLQDFKAGRRKNDLMAPIASGLQDKDMEDVSAYITTLKAVAPSAKAEEKK